MRDPIENISRLQTQLNDLQLENQILKNILDSAGISYRQELMRLHSADELCDYDPDQGARIQAPVEITEKMAVMFYSRFWGRQDVYAKRNEKKDTGEVNYFTQCHNFWQEMCPKKRREKINCIYAPDDEFLVKRKKAITAREKLVKTIQSGEVDYKDIREIIEYYENVDNYNVEQLSARILFDLTRNTGFEVSKGSFGACWIKSCCEWEERMSDGICGLDARRLPIKEKMKQICEGTSLLK